MSQTALLVQDVQNSIVDNFLDDAGNPEYLQRVAAAIAAARKANIPVIYVVISFRPGHPEISSNNAQFAGVRQRGDFVQGTPACAVAPAIAPQDGDVVVVKHRVGAFAGTDLEVILRSQGVQHLVLTGIATSGIVLSTLRCAADMDYKLTVLEDLCSDRDAEVHRVLMEKVFPHQATIKSSEEWIASLQG